MTKRKQRTPAVGRPPGKMYYRAPLNLRKDQLAGINTRASEDGVSFQDAARVVVDLGLSEYDHAKASLEAALIKRLKGAK